MIQSRNDWDPNAVVHPYHQDIYTDGSKLDNGVGSGIYSGSGSGPKHFSLAAGLL